MARTGIILSLALTASILLSCLREEDSGRQDTALLSVRISVPETKSVYDSGSGVGFENRITDIQILVFKEGIIEAWIDAGTSTYVSDIALTTGVKTVYVIANGPDLSGISMEDELYSVAVPFGQYNSEGNGFMMYGRTVTPALKRSGTTLIETDIGRKVCRLVINGISNSIPYAAPEITVRSAFVVNGGSDIPIRSDLPGSGGIGYNILGRHSGTPITTQSDEPSALLMKNINLTIPRGETWSDPFSLYAYPQDASGSGALRICILTEIGGSPYYYPIQIPSPTSNTSYNCTLDLVSLGCDDPAADVEWGMCKVSVSIAPWDEGVPGAFEKTI